MSDPAPNALVEAVNVTKAFHGNEVLKGIDLTVDRREVVCLLGPSGSGKTTFLRCINQLEDINGGRIWVDGELTGYVDKDGRLHRRTNKDIARQRRQIGMVFQRFNLFPHKTALENITEAPIQVGGKSRTDAVRRGLELLAIAWGILPPRPANDDIVNPAAQARTRVVEGDEVGRIVDRMVIANAGAGMRETG